MHCSANVGDEETQPFSLVYLEQENNFLQTKRKLIGMTSMVGQMKTQFSIL
jgi:hypothetical protein